MPSTSPIAQPVRQWTVAWSAERFSEGLCPWSCAVSKFDPLPFQKAESQPTQVNEEGFMGLLLAIALILLLFGIIGGVAISKFLFLILIVAAIIALFGFFARTA
jgi:hypothetical protein